MAGPLFEVLRTTTEASMRLQREMMEQWLRPLADTSANQADAATSEAAVQTRWLELATATWTRQGELMESAYRTGTQLMEQAARLLQAKTPTEYGRLAAELWRKTFDAIKSQSEAQLEELRRMSRLWLEAAKR